jgi:hypothetical protein
VHFTVLRIELKIKISRRDSCKELLDMCVSIELSIFSINGDIQLIELTLLTLSILREMSYLREIKLKEMPKDLEKSSSALDTLLNILMNIWLRNLNNKDPICKKQLWVYFSKTLTLTSYLKL